jgi:probable HAF family extracellular repeat protein
LLIIENLEDRCLLSYTVTDLGTLGGQTSVARAINNAGQVVGDSQLSGTMTHHGFLYSDGQMIDLGTLQGEASSANAINASGQVAGGSMHAFRDHNGTMTDLGTLGGSTSIAYGINNTGQVVGDAATASDDSTHAFLYRHGHMSDLGTLGGPLSHAAAINASGEVVGSAQTAQDCTHAFRFHWDTMLDLGTLGGDSSWATGLNNRGEVIGYATTTPGGFAPIHAFVSGHGTMLDLGTLGGDDSWAAAINNAGVIVGYSFNADYDTRAFLYYRGRMVDLNNLISPDSGWVLYEALGINDHGQIVGVGRCPRGTEHAFLLTPDQRPAAPSGPSLDPQAAQAIRAIPESQDFLRLRNVESYDRIRSNPIRVFGQGHDRGAAPLMTRGESEPRVAPQLARDAFFASSLRDDLFEWE